MVKAVHEKRTLADRIIVIDPEDVDCARALSMFDMKAARRERYARAINEQIELSLDYDQKPRSAVFFCLSCGYCESHYANCFRY